MVYLGEGGGFGHFYGGADWGLVGGGDGVVFIITPSPKLPFVISDESVFVSLPNVGSGVVFKKFFGIVTAFGARERERVRVGVFSPCPGLPCGVDSDGLLGSGGYLGDFCFPRGWAGLVSCPGFYGCVPDC